MPSEPVDALVSTEVQSPSAAMQGNTCFDKTDDAASDCSTVEGNQDIDALQQTDSYTEGSSDDGVETLLFFDWDDTLFPTSWIQQQGLCSAEALPNDEQRAQLQMVAESASRMLQEALQIGTVIIVTNAEQGWVEMSCSQWMPSVAHLLEKVDIVSARSTYESKSRFPSEWKRLAFACEVELFYGATTDSQPRNIISLGDALYEQLALTAVTKGVPNCCGKSLKFLPSPTVGQLIEEHQLVSGCLLDVAEQSDDLDVEVGI